MRLKVQIEKHIKIATRCQQRAVKLLQLGAAHKKRATELQKKLDGVVEVPASTASEVQS